MSDKTPVFEPFEVFPDAGAWRLPEDAPWRIPDDDEGFDVVNEGRWMGRVVKIRGLAITSFDFNEVTSTPARGFVLGYRNLLDPKESGYQIEGRVSIGGKKYSAFTSSRIFERPDRSLCDVAVLYVRGWRPKEG
jgi:hypothetical protein